MDEQAWCEPGGELASSGQYCFSGELGRRKLVFSWLSIKKPDLHDICFLFLKLCFEPVTSYKLLLFLFFFSFGLFSFMQTQDSANFSAECGGELLVLHVGGKTLSVACLWENFSVGMLKGGFSRPG